MDWTAHYANGRGRRLWPNTELAAFASSRPFTYAGKHGRVLELGCGAAANLRLWENGLTRTFGVDSYQPVLREAATVADGVACADIFSLPFIDGAFGLVVDCHTSQHVAWNEHGRLYRECRRVLAPGGWFWLCHLDALTATPKRHALASMGMDTYRSVGLFPTVTLTCMPTTAALLSEIRRAGFKPAVTRRWMREYPNGDMASYSIIEAEAR